MPFDLAFISVFDPLLGFLLELKPLYSIMLISLFVALISILATKFMTNQELMKSHRKKLKDMQKDMKKHRDDPKKSLKMQKDMMNINMLVMKESFKPMIITIIPFILIFTWLNANFSYLPIMPDDSFDITAKIKDMEGKEITIKVLPEDKVTFLSNKTKTIDDKNVNWELKAKEGSYTIRYDLGNKTYDQDLIVGNKYATPQKSFDPGFKSTIGNEKLKVDIFGLNLTWFWAYLIFSIIFSLLFRKIFKVS
ncbi:MAG: EMC3/TMCO1 family protein [Nanobdellota archaeon]